MLMSSLHRKSMQLRSGACAERTKRWDILRLHVMADGSAARMVVKPKQAKQRVMQ